MNKKYINENLYLRNKRKEKNITIKKLADDLGVSPGGLCLCELGRSATGELLARRLGEYFKDDWKKFLNEKVEKNGI